VVAAAIAAILVASSLVTAAPTVQSVSSVHAPVGTTDAHFAPPHSHLGIDPDGNGKLNYIVFDVSISVDVGKTYYLQGYMQDRYEFVISPSFNRTQLDPGAHTVRLTVSGARVAATGRDGPYTLRLELYDWASFEIIDFDNYTTGPYRGIDFEPPAISSPFTTTVPTIDGAMSPGEWADAHIENLSAISANFVPGLLFVKDDNERLYVAYDVTGDVTRDAYDTAAIGFDTFNDAIPRDGHDDQFALGGNICGEQAHLVYSSEFEFWILHDCPFDRSLPDHKGLFGAWGFGTSDYSAADHRIYELAIPFALIKVQPGGTIGFFGGSQASPGVYDMSADGYSAWPEYGYFLKLVLYGDLILSPDSTPPTVTIRAPTDGTVLGTNSTGVRWESSDVGLGLDHFEVRLDGETVETLPAKTEMTNLSGLSNGPHDIEVRAVDRGGNVGADTNSILVDMEAPRVSITSPASGSFVNTADVRVAWTASDAGWGVGEIAISLDGGPEQNLDPTATEYVFARVPDGPHSVWLQVADRGGFTTVQDVAFGVDTVAPFVSLKALPTAPLTTDRVDVAWTAGDSGSGLDRVTVALDGVPVATLGPTATAYSFTGVEDGSHIVVVTAIDSAGNAYAATGSFMVDTTPPTVSVLSPRSGAVVTTSDVDIMVSAADARSGLDRLVARIDGGAEIPIAIGSSSVRIAGLTDGPHTATIEARDRAGNTATVEVSFVVDTSVLSLSGPSGPFRIVGVGLGILVAGLAGYAIVRRRRRGRPE